MFTSTIVPVTIHGKQYGLQWNFAAIAAAGKFFGCWPMGKSFARVLEAYGAEHGLPNLYLVIGWCMLQASEAPATVQELRRLPPHECGPFVAAVQLAMGVGAAGPVPEKKSEEQGASPEKPEEGEGRSEAGTNTSSLPPSAAG